jgi:hypothetical protein
MKYIAQLILVLCLSLLLSTTTLRAQESLVFHKSAGTLLDKKISEWLKTEVQKNGHHEVALRNLNNGSLKEIILRFKDAGGSCSKLNGCLYYIIADTPEGLLRIGKFYAHKIKIAADSTKGVKNILACQNPWNDYDCQKYAWDDKTGKYKRKANGE